jgi:hypothetical protein
MNKAHTARCLANALVIATTNLAAALTSDYDRIMRRDENDPGLAGEFRSFAASGHILGVAEDNLADGSVDCKCPTTYWTGE